MKRHAHKTMQLGDLVVAIKRSGVRCPRAKYLLVRPRDVGEPAARPRDGRGPR